MMINCNAADISKVVFLLNPSQIISGYTGINIYSLFFICSTPKFLNGSGDCACHKVTSFQWASIVLTT
jgi:hypothetical protein